jgi:hypothetical protein
MDIEKARSEIEKTPMEDIERQTALTWGARAVASYHLCQEDGTLMPRFRHFWEGENYRQESFEHAAMAEDDGELLKQVREEIEQARSLAMQTFTALEASHSAQHAAAPAVEHDAGVHTEA